MVLIRGFAVKAIPFCVCTSVEGVSWYLLSFSANPGLWFGLGSACCFAQRLFSFALYMHGWPQHLPHSSPCFDYVSRLKASDTPFLLASLCVRSVFFYHPASLLKILGAGEMCRLPVKQWFEMLRSHLRTSPRNEAGGWCLFCLSIFGKFSCAACPTGRHLS